MSALLLLKGAKCDTTGQEIPMRVVGSREPPAKMAVQIEVAGAASVQIQGRIARDAPWLNVGPVYSASALAHLDPIQFLRAVTTGMVSSSSVSVWAVWGW